MKTMEQENVVCLSAGDLCDADMDRQASEHDVDNEDTLPIPDTQHENKTKSVRTLPIAPQGKKYLSSNRKKSAHLKVPSWESGSEESQSDGIWQLVTVTKPQRKKSVLYVGRTSKECSEKQIKEFVLKRAVTIEKRTPTVYAIRIFSKPSSDYNAARLTIDAASRPLLLNRNFWPRPIDSRAWNFEASVRISLARKYDMTQLKTSRPYRCLAESTTLVNVTKLMPRRQLCRTRSLLPLRSSPCHVSSTPK